MDDDDGERRATDDVVQMQNTKYVVYFCFFFSRTIKDVRKYSLYRRRIR